MKKSSKTALLIIAVLTVVLVILSAIMLEAVSGDALFYMDSRLGSVCAVSYRWVCLASVILILFWIAISVKNRTKFAEFFKKKEHKPKKTTDEMTAPELEQETEIQSAVNHCANCGSELKPDAAFCGECGQKVGHTDDNK